MKTKEEIASIIDTIVDRDVVANRVDWHKIDKPIFMKDYDEHSPFILSTRKTGCDIFMFHKDWNNPSMINRILGFYGVSRYYFFYPGLDKEPGVSSAMEIYHNLSLLYEAKGKGLIYTIKGWNLVDTK